MTEITGLTRRDRLRAATMEEITTTARRLLVEQGPDAASLRAIAREMGMTAPGLYRYYSSREELLRHVVASMFRELAGDIRGAIEAADPKPLEFKLTFDKAACNTPFTGRVYVTIRTNNASPPLGLNWFFSTTPGGITDPVAVAT